MPGPGVNGTEGQLMTTQFDPLGRPLTTWEVTRDLLAAPPRACASESPRKQAKATAGWFPAAGASFAGLLEVGIDVARVVPAGAAQVVEHPIGGLVVGGPQQVEDRQDRVVVHTEG